MKKFESPVVEIEELAIADVIATSAECVGNTQLPEEEA